MPDGKLHVRTVKGDSETTGLLLSRNLTLTLLVAGDGVEIDLPDDEALGLANKLAELVCLRQAGGESSRDDSPPPPAPRHVDHV